MRRQVADGGTRVRLARALVLLVVAGGLAFAAAQFAPPPTRLRQADPMPAEGPPPAAPDASEEAGGEADIADAGDAPAGADGAGEEPAEVAPVRELTAEEIEAELEAAEAAMGGAAPADARNRAAERPLPADLPVALPSDI